MTFFFRQKNKKQKKHERLDKKKNKINKLMDSDGEKSKNEVCELKSEVSNERMDC